ncbi:MAG TPA: hypothetical protein VL173_09380 [Vicinamibacterales bacterium]|nr:hypothetical protein [Vicinamibacterales bacterium]
MTASSGVTSPISPVIREFCDLPLVEVETLLPSGHPQGSTPSRSSSASSIELPVLKPRTGLRYAIER